MNYVDECFEVVKADIELNKASLGRTTEKYVYVIIEAIKDSEEKAEVAGRFEKIAEISAPKVSVFLYTAALYLDLNEKRLRKMLNCTFENRDIIGTDDVYAIYQQAAHLTFSNPMLDSNEVLMLENQMYSWSLGNYIDKYDDIVTIPPDTRNKNLVFVIAQQVISFQHGPTKSALDRCKILMDIGYEVVLINTAELLPRVFDTDFVGEVYCSYVEEYLNKEYIEWKGEKIPFFQCEQDMPNYLTIRQLIDVVKEQKPFFAVSIASGTIFEGILSKLIPVLGIPMTQSELAISGASYQANSVQKNDKYYKSLNVLNLNENHIIDVLFGFSLLEQKEKHYRKEYGIDSNSFVIVTAGGRLQIELDEAFWNMFRKIVKEIPNVKLLIIGNYDVYEELSDISQYIILVGFVDDTLSYFEICDLYINPHRKGGGTSCVEAMYKGLPVVTDDYGDVATNAGEVFVVGSDYSNFPSVVLKYYEDKEFYKKQQQLAISRANKLLNAEGEFVKAIDEFKRRFLSVK